MRKVSTLALPWLWYITFASAQREDEKPTFRPVFTRRPFLVAWNAPTQDCQPRFGVQLDFSLFDLQASPNEGFVDQNLTIFYKERLGLYPYYEQQQAVNGGVPQNSSLLEHLDRLPEGINKYIRSLHKDGLAVIDWEEWRPIWVRNWQSKDIYRKASRQLVAAKHTNWSEEEVGKQAVFEFEASARDFMVKTLQHAKSYRPRQLWGYYLFPDCYNHDYNKNADTYTGRCPDVEESRNDQLAWLWKESTALYPSIYLDQVLASSENGRKFVRSRVKEARRIANKHHEGYSLPVFVYTRPTYSRKLQLLSEETCQMIKRYLEDDLGRYIVNVTTAAQLCSQVLCHANGRCLRRENHTNAYLHLPASSFRIVQPPVEGGHKSPALRAEGQFSRMDIESLKIQFRCQCYVGWKGQSCEQQEPVGNSAVGSDAARALKLLTSLLLCALVLRL
ncbi:hyaluronidase-2-like isoform X2 [Rhinatrema bivittatum]|uniref:hyaluronidase-2-like isoform X2 n=1 Tax=Rhinatrema bivittatum TaxID=194408 RepID=UPI00112E7AB8|nr:hyaluronidase-2-like isoform X2 [Rhinatrema bivittatum]